MLGLLTLLILGVTYVSPVWGALGKSISSLITTKSHEPPGMLWLPNEF